MHTPLLTDLYQLTMAEAYWRAGLGAHEAAFHLFFRRAPFQGGFAIAAGLGPALAWLEGLRYTEAELAYIASLHGPAAVPLFSADFLVWLGGLQFNLDIDAMPEGEAAFPHEPLLRVRGPLIAAQIVETALLNLINFQTLIATKAARIRLAAGADTVIEMGLRRAQGMDGGVTASRAAFVGGADATSNVAAGYQYGIPVRGTHAHAFVMAFGDEPAAFAAYAAAMPHNAVFLVDTYDTLTGVDHAIAEGRRLRARGGRLGGIRLDSGDLAALSIAARARLDAAGFVDAVIVASSDLDEHAIVALKAAGAPITVWGVGTRLVTGHDQPALGGVYKLAAIRAPGKDWSERVKRSDEPAKQSIPGLLQVRRGPDGDVIWDTLTGPPDAAGVDLLSPVMRGGERVGPAPTLTSCRDNTIRTLAGLPEGTRRLVAPTPWPVSLEPRLADRRARMLA